MSLNKNIEIFSRVRLVDKLLFTKHLAVMLKSGVPISEAIGLLVEQTKSTTWKKVLTSLADAVKNGQPLSKSMAKYPKVFDPLYVHIVAIGEGSGNLEKNLAYLEKELKKSYEFKARFKAAMIYPTIIVVVALVVGLGISIFILPQMATLFKSLDVDLPISTKVLIFVADVMSRFGVFIIIGIIFATFAFITGIKTKTFKPVWDKFKLKIPVWGKMAVDANMATFCRNMGLMLSSGVAIEQAAKITSESSENEVFRNYGRQMASAIEKGHQLEKELGSGRYRYIPNMAIKMIGVGEKTGKLPETFLYLGDFWESEVDEKAKNIMSVLEPVMLLVIAGMVAFLALSIISPIYQFTGSVKK